MALVPGRGVLVVVAAVRRVAVPVVQVVEVAVVRDDGVAAPRTVLVLVPLGLLVVPGVQPAAQPACVAAPSRKTAIAISTMVPPEGVSA